MFSYRIGSRLCAFQRGIRRPIDEARVVPLNPQVLKNATSKFFSHKNDLIINKGLIHSLLVVLYKICTRSNSADMSAENVMFYLKFRRKVTRPIEN